MKTKRRGAIQQYVDTLTPTDLYVWTIEYNFAGLKWTRSSETTRIFHEQKRLYTLDEAMTQAVKERDTRSKVRRVRNIVTNQVIMADIL